ncbi:hypothetical protein HK098_004226 [Nowakowskiella sp. JEL0407]|nr:hypothetical protein HK098_004226 [Nowakowskiella sp. JEL0407]
MGQPAFEQGNSEAYKLIQDSCCDDCAHTLYSSGYKSVDALSKLTPEDLRKHGISDEHSDNLMRIEILIVVITKDPLNTDTNPASANISQQITDQEYDVFLSYSWAQQKEVLKIRDALRSRGFTVWIDVDVKIMPGDLWINALMVGIRSSKIIIPCLSQQYEASDNLERELSYAAVSNKKIIPILLDDGPFSWTELITAGVLYVDFSNVTLSEFESRMDMLTGVIRREISAREENSTINDQLSDPTTVYFELRINETSQKLSEQFDRYVDSVIAVCNLPLFRAAFLSTVIYEYLFPMSNQPYKETDNEIVEERLWADFTKLHNVVKGRKTKNFKLLLEEASPLLEGFGYDVKKGSFDLISRLNRRILDDYLVDAVTEVFHRMPMFLAIGPPTNTAISVTTNADVKYLTDSLRITKANITQNRRCVNLLTLGTGLITPYALNFNNQVAAFRITSGRSGENHTSKFWHLNEDFRNKVMQLQQDFFPPSVDPCREEKLYHDIFISYRREPKSETARDWITIALEKINDRYAGERKFHWFIDEDCLESGESFTEQFLDALLHAKVVILIITEETLKLLTAGKKDNVVLERD